MPNKNVDNKTIESFGDEWKRHTQHDISKLELNTIFEKYFYLVDWAKLPQNPKVFDMGCGSGRWANFVASKIERGLLTCIDPSEAINVAKKNLSHHKNIIFTMGDVDDCGLALSSQDFGYSLGVLHHVPNTEQAIHSCVNYLKPGAPLLLYLYYNFENRSSFFKLIWHLSNLIRLIVSSLTPGLKNIITIILAAIIYYPLSRIARILEILKISYSWVPLSFYRNSSFKTMMTDSRDRFGTPLEQRFSRQEIKKMMENSGLERIEFLDSEPYWVAIGFKRK